MTSLTEKILSLDLQSASVLQDAKVASSEAKKSADKYASQKMQEAQRIFEEEKESEATALTTSFEEERKRARFSLDQKMRTFDKDMKIDTVVEALLKVTKERICL